MRIFDYYIQETVSGSSWGVKCFNMWGTDIIQDRITGGPPVARTCRPTFSVLWKLMQITLKKRTFCERSGRRQILSVLRIVATFFVIEVCFAPTPFIYANTCNQGQPKIWLQWFQGSEVKQLLKFMLLILELMNEYPQLKEAGHWSFHCKIVQRIMMINEH